jgi:hypothetical protein
MYSSTHSLVGVHCSGVFKLYLLFEQIGRDNTNMHIACVECGPTLDGAHRNDAVALSPERGYTRDSGDGGHYTHTHTHGFIFQTAITLEWLHGSYEGEHGGMRYA